MTEMYKCELTVNNCPLAALGFETRAPWWCPPSSTGNLLPSELPSAKLSTVENFLTLFKNKTCFDSGLGSIFHPVIQKYFLDKTLSFCLQMESPIHPPIRPLSNLLMQFRVKQRLEPSSSGLFDFYLYKCSLSPL